MNAIELMTTARGTEAKQTASPVAARRSAASRTRGRLAVKLASPQRAVRGISPEQLFAAGWSASFLNAIEQTAADLAVRLPSARAVDAEVDLGTVEANGYFRRVRLSISLPGLPREVARELVEAAYAACPYWSATLGNIDVAVEIA